ncbi:MAG TPA: orotate phosphoribosyltransferase [Abditibacteriaceae bacterium]|jgi:orotate phosphoribosyltransferase
MNDNHQSFAKRIFEVSNIRGEFRLRSGRISEEYFDKYLFETNPVLLQEIAQGLSQLVPPNVDALAGLEMGGIPIATLLSQITGIPALFVRKTPKEYGTCKFVEGGEVENRKLVIVEDIVTSGGQIIMSANALRESGAEIVRVLCVIDREEGGKENLAAEGLDLHSLFTMQDLKA